MTQLIPAVDAAGIPGPAWLFHFLLVFTFFLHLLFMNVTLGGTILAAVAHLMAGGRSDDPRGALAGRLMAVNNYGISLTITTGVAPLLFLQVLYHQFFYPATILIAGVWLAFLVVLTVGYYAAYGYKFKGAPAKGGGGGVWLWTAALSFVLIAMVHVSVHLIHSQPQTWRTLADNPWVVLGDPTFGPRLFHFVFAAIGFAALVAAWWAGRQARAGRDVELNIGIAAYAWKWVLWMTALEVVDGFILLFVLPRPVLLELMRGGAATMGPLTLAIVLAIGLLMMVARVGEVHKSAGTVFGVLMTVTGVIAIMSVTRHQLRILYLEQATELAGMTVVPQWLNFGLFAVLLVGGLATVAYMVWRVLNSPATEGDAA